MSCVKQRSYSCCCLGFFATTVFLGVDANAARREFLSYCLSLMRAHNGEHLDSLPILDVSALKHVAYVFDALIYYMRSGTLIDSVDNEGLSLPPWNDQVSVKKPTEVFFETNLFRMKTKTKKEKKIYLLQWKLNHWTIKKCRI